MYFVSLRHIGPYPRFVKRLREVTKYEFHEMELNGSCRGHSLLGGFMTHFSDISMCGTASGGIIRAVWHVNTFDMPVVYEDVPANIIGIRANLGNTYHSCSVPF